MNEHLYRSRDDRMIAGVAGGLAERLDLDAALIRIVWLLLMPLTGGFALLVYIVMAIVVPDEDRAWMPYTAAAAWTATPPVPGGSDMGTTPAAGDPMAGASAMPQPSWAAGSAGSPASASPTMDRSSWRAQRRAERAVRRAGRHSGNGALIAGGVLIVLGALFLVREYVPEFDGDRLWPLFLIGIGVVFLLAAFARHPARPGADIR